jgi:acyl-CoA synthetase (AMP-forming)/AMP-acid ligase II
MIHNIADAFVRAARENSGRTAIVDAVSGESIPFGELDRRADAFAYYFREAGLTSGQVVSLMVTPGIDFICITIALFKIGTPIVLIDPGMGYKNLLRCIERVAPKYLIGVPLACGFARFARRTFASVEKFFCLGPSLFGFPGINIRRGMRETVAENFPVYQPGADDLAAIIFTTGSTGPPKGVRYEHSIFAAQLRMIRDYYKIGPKDIDQPAFPLFALFSTALGACAVIPDMDPTRPAQVDPVKFTKSIQKYGVTYSFGSPAIWNVVSRWCIDNGVQLDSLRKVLMAGAPVAPELIQRMKKILPAGAEVITPYGATESLPIVSIEGDEILENSAEKSCKGEGICVGRPLPGISIRIVAISDQPVADISDTVPCSVGEIGEIIVQGEVVTRGYMNNAEETRLAKIPGENGSFWHRMGDTGYFDEAGLLWFCGRRAHRVVRHGEKGQPDTTWFSIPCEAIVNQHPAVYRSALVGVVSPEENVEPVLIVEYQKDVHAGEKELREVELLASNSPLTKDIHHFLVHPDFPVDIRHNAKIFREKLAIWAQQKIYPHE